MELTTTQSALSGVTWELVFTNPRSHASAVVATFAIKKHADICYNGIASLDPDNRILYALRRVDQVPLHQAAI
ncbi:MAG: hypothetical protein QNJ46_30495 [Leptolyngbyaceae cyanobacterium MO_188.B28]|nr:hypothetical protein [Leptolyngbyaceae cyanobacterium MO_188.B28]